MAKVTNQYNEESIQVLDGLEAVRKRPGMYIGSTDARGLHHLIWEIVDNAIDETLAGFGSHIVVRIHQDNSVEIADNGRGIPTGNHKSNGLPTPQVIFNTLHAGGKFGGDGAYKVSGGLHGVGSSVVNALSEYLEVTIHRDGKIFYQRYLNGGRTIEKVKWLGKTNRTGSIIKFKPDSKVFSTTNFDYKTVATRLKESAYLIKGLRIDLIDMRSGNAESFHYENGIVEFVKSLTAGKEVIHEPALFSGEYGGIYIEASIQYSKAYSENVLSFVNNVRTRDGGTHETGFKSALTRAFNEHARMIGLLKDKDPNLDGADIREGLTAILSIRVPEDLLQFEGQTKNKLGSPEARNAVELVITEKLKFFLAEKGEISTVLVNNAIKASKAREAARKARDEARMVKQVKTSKPTNLLGKLTPVQVNNPKINELFLVEGDSAGGSAKQGRDRTFQAILPLRGKVINTEIAKIDEILKNEEILTMISTIGAGFGSDFDISKCNYNRIIIMTDADTDGAHIQILLLTFFFRYMTELVEAGKIFIATPPLYKITTKNNVEYAWSDEELRDKIANQKNVAIQRYKGLGEMNPEQLWETTMDPAKRTLVQVKISDYSEADNRVSVLMGDDVEPRREWIDNNVVFEYDDNFVLEDLVEDEQ